MVFLEGHKKKTFVLILTKFKEHAAVYDHGGITRILWETDKQFTPVETYVGPTGSSVAS